MSPNATHLVIAAALLAAPATLGVATQTDLLEDTSPSTQALQTNQEAETIETFQGEVPEDVVSGELDLRVDRGTVKVVGWDKSEYKIEVLESREEATAGDGETKTTWDESIDGDAISLSLVVDHQSQARVDVDVEDDDGTAHRAIVAHVPQRLSYEEVYACEGETMSGDSDLGPITHEREADCVESAQHTLVDADLHANHNRDEDERMAWALQGLEGENATVLADDEPLQLADVDFASLTVQVDDGDVEVANVSAEELHLLADDGNVAGGGVATDTLVLAADDGNIDLDADAEEVRADVDDGSLTLAGAIRDLQARTDDGGIDVDSDVLSNGTVEADDGSIDLTLQPAESGELALSSDDGPIDVTLGHHGDVGYDVVACTDDGPVDVTLADETDGEATDACTGEEQEAARTSGYSSLPIQLAIDAEADDGSIDITEDSAAQDDASDDGEESSAGLTTLAN